MLVAVCSAFCMYPSPTSMNSLAKKTNSPSNSAASNPRAVPSNFFRWIHVLWCIQTAALRWYGSPFFHVWMRGFCLFHRPRRGFFRHSFWHSGYRHWRCFHFCFCLYRTFTSPVDTTSLVPPLIIVQTLSSTIRLLFTLNFNSVLFQRIVGNLNYNFLSRINKTRKRK